MSNVVVMRFEVGAMLKGRVRGMCDFYGATWSEYRNFLSSTFVVRVPSEQWGAFNAEIGRLIGPIL